MSIWFTIIIDDLAYLLKNALSVLYNFYKVVTGVNRIKEMRLQHGMQQKDLAKVLNCTQTAVSRYENGTRDLDVATICTLCDVFGCTADYLIGRSARQDPELTPEEEQLLAAWTAATPEIRAIIDAALKPYKEEAAAGSPATA